MKIAKMVVVVPLAFLAGPALAENWIAVATDNGMSYSVDKDSIRRGDDGLIFFTSDTFVGKTSIVGKMNNAVDCQQRVYYTLKIAKSDYPGWRNAGDAVKPNSTGEAELNFVCANVR
jgi:hypothetical protein